jgi:phospholipase/lecithinase/hemolysin
MVSLWKISFTAAIVVLAPLSAQAGPHSLARSSDAWGSGGFPFERIVTFGDSLSDPGNAFVATGDFVVRPFDPIPDAPYLIGLFHFSNGPTWIEWLARDVRLFSSGRPALLSPGVYTDYAVGSARARTREGDPVNLGIEIGLFLDDFGGVASPDDLYAVWIGANDLRDALQDPADAAAIVAEALQATVSGIQQLYDAGARSFLVVNQPNLAITPALNTQPEQAQAAARALSAQYNSALEQFLSGLETTDADIAIARLDVFTILNAAVADPAAVRLTNVTDSCITPDVIVGAICRHPNRYLFWDFVHPTTKAHRLLSQDAEASLAETFGLFHGVAASTSPPVGTR